MTDFYVTFGSQYPREGHPTWAGAHRDGWLRVVADDELAARLAVIEKLGRAWSSIYESLADMSVEYYPLGELGVLQDGQITNSDYVAAWLGTAIS